MPSESVRRGMRVWCLLAPIRGGVLPLGETPKRGAPSETRVYFVYVAPSPSPCERALPRGPGFLARVARPRLAFAHILEYL